MRGASTRSGVRRRSARGLRRPVPARLARRSVLAASGVVALGLGVGVPVAWGVLTGTGADAAVPPAACAAAQDAWSRAAAAQVSLSAEDPGTLRRGFTGARDALAEVTPPGPVASDWDVVRGYLATVADAIDGTKDDDDVVAVVGATLSGLDTAAMTASSDRVTAYLRADCTPG